MNTTFDAYEAIPFHSYRAFNAGCVTLEHCRSLMHFIEAEKFVGVDEQYRRFVLSIEDRDDFLLETAGVSQGCLRKDWVQKRDRLIYAGVWMQVVQNKERLLAPLLAGELTSDLKPINDALAAVRNRILDSGDDPLRQVLVSGCTEYQNESTVFSMLDAVFANRKPDELLIRCEAGVSEHVARYAHANYIPLRVIGLNTDVDELEEVSKYASHVFIATPNDTASGFASRCYEVAVQAGKVAHMLKLDAVCA